MPTPRPRRVSSTRACRSSWWPPTARCRPGCGTSRPAPTCSQRPDNLQLPGAEATKRGGVVSRKRVSDGRLSKTLALILRHDPARFDLEVDRRGSVGVDALVAALRRHG